MAMIASGSLLISGGTFSQTIEGGSRGERWRPFVPRFNVYHVVVDLFFFNADFEKLAQRVATQARHDTGELAEPAKCHPDTRVAILTDLLDWAQAITYNYPVKWMTGSAGVGKTAIARSIAEILKRRNLLLADFFFWRTGDRCNTAEFFVSTLAYQIAISLPETRPFIENAIRQDPHIFTRTLESQSQALIVGPITSVFQEGRALEGYPRIFVVDGLDECLGSNIQSQDIEKQTEILRVLYWTLSQLPAPFALLIASRPEYQIRRTLGTLPSGVCSAIMLNDSYDAEEDIRRFYLSKFREIQEHHPLRAYLPSGQWPATTVVEDLVNRASGQFIYASTVIRFIAASKRNPLNQLDRVLQSSVSGNTKPFKSLDLLYSVIFMVIDEEDLAATLRVLGILLLGRSRSTRSSRNFSPDALPPSFWDRFLGFRSGELQRLMLGLESVLSIQGLDKKYFRFYHASLQDFLFDPSRSQSFFIDAEVVYEDLAKRSICHLSTCDADIEAYVLFGMQYWFTYAKPSRDLQFSVSQLQVPILPRHLKLWFPILLGVILQSRLEQRRTLYNQLMKHYLSQLALVVSPYLEHEPLIFLLLAAIEGGGTAAGLMGDLLRTVQCHLTPEMLLIDKHGFSLQEDRILQAFLCADVEYIMDYNVFTETALVAVLQNQAMADYEMWCASAAAHLLKSFQQTSR
ncbi:hypothetical protein CVT26_009650 [Gymnopilus dilepis]|uniref:Nephrocystin 3-like N-terminal domain-containing protein n=1 Tax=Gymnopilus dilepis TaxID=231916 RepID=A0A409VKN3_9AGAR|nr:hypothetical protein CVT26_009650 [Gymnopilus dilepis]